MPRPCEIEHFYTFVPISILSYQSYRGPSAPGSETRLQCDTWKIMTVYLLSKSKNTCLVTDNRVQRSGIDFVGGTNY